jgi:hypothetical protein
MIRFTNVEGEQSITEVCEDCKCHIRDLSVSDIVVQGSTTSGMVIQDDKGEEITRTKLDRPLCKCNDCGDE